MFKTTAIRKEAETIEFLQDLKKLFAKHDITMLHGSSHIEFLKKGKVKIAQCFCVNGGSSIT